MKFQFLILLSVLFSFACNPRESATPNRPISSDATNEVKVSIADSDPAEPAIAADVDGNIYVAYVEHAADKSADLYIQKFDSKLKSIGEPVRVNPESGIVKSWAGDPPTVTSAPDKSLFIGWTARSGDGTNYVVSVSHDGGTTFSAPTKINDDIAPASHGMHSLAIGNDGTIYAAWLDERNIHKDHEMASKNSAEDEGFHFVKIDHKGPASEHAPEPNSEVFFAYSKDGGKSFSKNQKLSTDVCPCCKTAVTTDETRRVYVSWRQVLEGDHRHIAVASSTNGGETFLPRTIVSDDKWQLAACPVSGAAIKATASELDVLWYTAGVGGQAGYYTAKSTDGGANFGPRIFVSGDAASGTPILLGSTLVYQGADNRTVIAIGADSATKSTIDAANNPSAVSVSGVTYIAFVRKENKTRSVWIAKR
ncbi:MAG: hypothetical protein DMF63_09025 [Acidobacteria bacterium]|nr:MAG: hypothetical protein DMF63_09025 [Acidobacteriota bacterium]